MFLVEFELKWTKRITSNIATLFLRNRENTSRLIDNHGWIDTERGFFVVLDLRTFLFIAS